MNLDTLNRGYVRIPLIPDDLNLNAREWRLIYHLAILEYYGTHLIKPKILKTVQKGYKILKSLEGKGLIKVIHTKHGLIFRWGEGVVFVYLNRLLVLDKNGAFRLSKLNLCGFRILNILLGAHPNKEWTLMELTEKITKKTDNRMAVWRGLRRLQELGLVKVAVRTQARGERILRIELIFDTHTQGEFKDRRNLIKRAYKELDPPNTTKLNTWLVFNIFMKYPLEALEWGFKRVEQYHPEKNKWAYWLRCVLTYNGKSESTGTVETDDDIKHKKEYLKSVLERSLHQRDKPIDVEGLPDAVISQAYKQYMYQKDDYGRNAPDFLYLELKALSTKYSTVNG